MIDATEFLNQIAAGEDAPHCFQVFDDTKKTKTAQIISGKFSELKDRLNDLNGRKLGIYVTVNETDGNGRRKKNILSPRALFADFDGVEMPDFAVKPSMVVKSKNGEHAYWLLKEGESLERFKPTQKLIAKKFGSDPSVNDEGRVMRVPGFYHWKDENDPFKVELLESHPRQFTIDEVVKGLGLAPKDEGYESFKEWAFKGGRPKNRNNSLTAILREGLARNFNHNQLLLIVAMFCKKYDFDHEEAMECFQHQVRYWLDGGFEVRESIKPKQKLEFKPLSMLLTQPDIEHSWVVEELLIDSGSSVLASGPKLGKSTLMRNLAMRVARGEKFLGRETTKGAVLYLALEEQEEQVKKHFRSMGCDGSEEIHIHSFVAPEDCLQQLQDAINEIKPKLVIIDTLFKFVRVKDGNDYSGIISALEPLTAMARRSGCHIIGIHHSKKNSSGSPENDVLGSQGIFASVDTGLFMVSKNKKRIISSVQRYGEPLDPHILEMNPDTGTVVMNESKDEYDHKSCQKRIFYALADHPDQWFTEREVKEMVPSKTAIFRKALRACCDATTLVRQGKGIRKDPFLYKIHPEVHAKGKGNKNEE